MSGTLGDVVARLYSARERLLAAAVTANRAQADANQAAVHYSEAARGSTDQSIKTRYRRGADRWRESRPSRRDFERHL